MVRTDGRLLVYVDLVQDIDVLLPVMLGWRARMGRAPVIRVARWLREASPRTETLLRDHGLGFGYVRRVDVIAARAPALFGVRAVLTASESSLEAHRAGHVLANRATERGIPTFLLQHGLEMAGLHHDLDATFASSVVLTWSDPARFTRCEPPTRGKLVGVGRPGAVDTVCSTEDARVDVAVFENLHWDRYSTLERERFMSGLLGLAEARPSLAIAVRAHPAGGWMDGQAERLATFPNIAFTASVQARREVAGAASLIDRCRRVVTTPSTIALDAASRERPVALTTPGGDAYAPLPVVASASDWLDFSETLDAEPSRTFFRNAVMPGDAVARIVEQLAAAVTP